MYIGLGVLGLPHAILLYFCGSKKMSTFVVMYSFLFQDEIKKVVDEACYKLPTTINNTCIEFVNTYGDALVAILAQEIDPSTVCPLIRACPSSEVKDVEIFMQEKGDNSKCPLCLFAVSKLEDMVKDKKTEVSCYQHKPKRIALPISYRRMYPIPY